MLVSTETIIWLLRVNYLLFSRRDSSCWAFSKASLTFRSSSVVSVLVKITILKVILCNEQLTSTFLFLLKKNMHIEDSHLKNHGVTLTFKFHPPKKATPSKLELHMILLNFLRQQNIHNTDHGKCVFSLRA